MDVVVGIDVGTQGVRILAVDPGGQIVASAHQAFAPVVENLPPGWLEQSPYEWWEAVKNCCARLLAALPAEAHISGLCVDSTSGTILPIDASGNPLHPAVMYNDRRSEAQAKEVQAAGAAHQARFGIVFGSSFALPKILWFKQQRPEIYARSWRFLHAADFIVGRFTSCYDFSDASNALKTGYDLIDLCWPDFIFEDLEIPPHLLPQVILPGQPIGQVSRQAAEETGLPQGVSVFAGVTDGTAAQIASGAARPGEWNSTLGTTLVLKGIARELAIDPQGRIYSHRHPEGGNGEQPWWMPGGASNTGAEWITLDHPGADPAQLDRLAAPILPTGLVRYPLARRGERFPFLHPAAEGFVLGEPLGEAELYAAGLEGLALVERLAYETVQGLGLEVGETIYITGGGSRSLLWSQIRASVLGRTLARPAAPEAAMGAAILAASGCWFGSLSEAVRNMVKIAGSIQPETAWQAAYQDCYRQFVDELRRREYIGQG